MFRRLISAMLIGVLITSTCAPALAEGVSAGDLLFGSGAAATPVVEATAAPEAPSEANAAETDVYGTNDTASISAYQVLKLGDRDAADGAAYIVMLQNRLISLGFLSDSADGVYGANTETAVKQFQKLNGLEETGIADEMTQQKLFSDLTMLITPSPENPVVYGAESIRVQTKLSEWGFLIGGVDGKLGSASAAAIKSFKDYVMQIAPQEPTPTPSPSPTPTPVPTTAPGELPSVMDEMIVTPSPEPTPFVATAEVDELLLSFVDSQRPFAIYRQSVQNGDKNAEVKRVQTRLKQLGYLYAEPDGDFGSATELALKYFQRKNGLSESGIADQETQLKLFSGDVQKSEEYVFPYKILVDISEQRVYVYKWEGEGYTGKEKSMICSTGMDKTPTPTGTYQSYGRMVQGEWFYFEEFNCYAKWAYGIVGGILFHSVTYSSKKVLNKSSVNKLGRKASHGCIRLEEEAAKWIYDNCPIGTTVVIQE